MDSLSRYISWYTMIIYSPTIQSLWQSPSHGGRPCCTTPWCPWTTASAWNPWWAATPKPRPCAERDQKRDRKRDRTVAAGRFLADKSRDRFPDADHKERLHMITSHNAFIFPWPSHVPPSTEFHQKRRNMLLTNVLNYWLAGISISTLTNPSNFRCLPWRAAPLSRWNLNERTWRRGWLNGWSMACDLELKWEQTSNNFQYFFLNSFHSFLIISNHFWLFLIISDHFQSLTINKNGIQNIIRWALPVLPSQTPKCCDYPGHTHGHFIVPHKYGHSLHELDILNIDMEGNDIVPFCAVSSYSVVFHVELQGCNSGHTHTMLVMVVEPESDICLSGI